MDGALMRADNAGDDVETEASSLPYRLGGEERFEDAATNFGGNARAIVGEFDYHLAGLEHWVRDGNATFSPWAAEFDAPTASSIKLVQT